jgi:hypothetical protein
MPLTAKGTEIMGNMTKTYGAKKAKQVFYASRNSGKIKGVDKPRMNKKKSSAPKTAMN